MYKFRDELLAVVVMNSVAIARLPQLTRDAVLNSAALVARAVSNHIQALCYDA